MEWRVENVHSAERPLGGCLRVYARYACADKRSAKLLVQGLFRSLSPQGGCLDMWARKGRTPGWLPVFLFEPQGDSDG